jgi:hypothetical protein
LALFGYFFSSFTLLSFKLLSSLLSLSFHLFLSHVFTPTQKETDKSMSGSVGDEQKREDTRRGNKGKRKMRW